MSIENMKSNIVTVAVSGATRILNLEQVLFAHVGSTTSTVYVNEGASVPANLVIEGDFRNLVAGAGGAGMNSGPIFGAFTETGAHTPVVINFDKLSRYVDASTLKFSKYGTVAAFTYTLLENPVDVLGNAGYSVQDVGIFSVNQTGNTISAPLQTAAATAATGGTVAANTYYMKVTSLNSNGETTGSNEVSIVTSGSTSTITANWAAAALATGGYNVYIGTSAGAESSYFHVAAGVLTKTITALPGTTGTVPVANTATDTSLNVQELINAKNVTHQVPSGTNWTTTFVDASSVLYVESLQDLVGG